MCRLVICRVSRGPGDLRRPQVGDVVKIVEDGVFVGLVFEGQHERSHSAGKLVYRIAEMPGVPAATMAYLLADQRGFSTNVSKVTNVAAANKRVLYRSTRVDIAALEGQERELRGLTALGDGPLLVDKDRIERLVTAKPHVFDPRILGP